MAASELTDYLRSAPQLGALFSCAGISGRWALRTSISLLLIRIAKDFGIGATDENNGGSAILRRSLQRCISVTSGRTVVTPRISSGFAIAFSCRKCVWMGTIEGTPVPKETMLNLDAAQSYSQLRPSGHICPVQWKLFSILSREKESGKKGGFNAVQIMKNVSGKNLFRITAGGHHASQ